MRNFDAGHLNQKYAFLDAVPETLFEQVVAARGGRLEEVAGSVVTLRDALLEGHLPDIDRMSWPEGELRLPVLEALESLEVAKFCEDQPDLADSLISSLLETFEERQSLQLTDDIEEVFEELAESRRRERLVDSRVEAGVTDGDVFELFEGSDHSDWRDWCAEVDRERLEELVELEAERLEELGEEAERRVGREATDRVTAEFLDRWRPLAEAWHQLADVFTDLSEVLGRGWDFARGIIEHDGWMDVVAMREMVEQIPELEELIRTLGRLQVSEEDEVSVSETIFETVRRRGQKEVMKETPRAPVETRGVRRSDDITRMLPVEALKLTRPALTNLFHARRCEHALATYRVEGVMPEHVETEEDVEEEIEREREKPEKERGPIIVCLDTSGSMHGTPERVAKALTLEAVRVAHQEGRRCFVYAFSGPDQVAESEISLHEEGFGDFLNFLRRSFHGGTDVEVPLRRATERLERENWKRSDLLLVSDGEFPVSDSLASRLEESREEAGSTLHGVLVGGGRQSAMTSLCDELHRFDDWQALESVRSA